MIYTIGYARGIAALFVILFHFRDYINGVYAQGNLGEILFGPGVAGVDVFFVISGFIIVHSTMKNENRNILNFLARRFFRISSPVSKRIGIHLRYAREFFYPANT